MADRTFRAYRVTEAKKPAELVTLSDSDLPEGDLLVRVTHSCLNYKDGLAMLGKPGVVRSYPLTCGVDLAGEVVEGGSGFEVGDAVVLTGAGQSETRHGGYSEYQRIEAAYVVPTPEKLGPWGAMAIGTAGLTAALCVIRLESAGLTRDLGPVLVTGATGGVGSVAVRMLSELGFEVHASTGKESEHDYLTGLGAAEIVSRESLTTEGRPLDKQRWAGCVDSVGGATLATVLSQMKYGGVVAACGLAGGNDLPTTVLPFILRNVSLLGVESVYASIDQRRQAWARLQDVFSVESLRELAVDASFEQLPALCEQILKGGIRGRVVVSPST